jgi:hypothetical protein
VADSFIQCENVHSVSKKRLRRQLGRESEDSMQQVEDRLRTSGSNGLRCPTVFRWNGFSEGVECAAGALECGGLTPPWNLPRSAGRLQSGPQDKRAGEVGPACGTDSKAGCARRAKVCTGPGRSALSNWMPACRAGSTTFTTAIRGAAPAILLTSFVASHTAAHGHRPVAAR